MLAAPLPMQLSAQKATISMENEIGEDMAEEASTTASIPRRTNCHLLIQMKNWVFFYAPYTSDLQNCLFPFSRQYFSIFNTLNLSNGAHVKMYISVWVGAQDFTVLVCLQVDEMDQRTHLCGPLQLGVGTGAMGLLSTLSNSFCAQGI